MIRKLSQQAQSLPSSKKLTLKTDIKPHRCEACSKSFTAMPPDHICQRCMRILCNSCAPSRIIVPSISTESQSRVCKQCFTEFLEIQKFQNESKWARDLRLKVQSDPKFNDLQQDFKALKEALPTLKEDRTVKQQMEKIKHLTQQIHNESCYSIRELYHYTFKQQENQVAQVVDMVLLLSKKQQSNYFNANVNLCLFFLSLCDEETSFIFISMLYASQQYDLVSTCRDYLMRHLGVRSNSQSIFVLDSQGQVVMHCYLMNCLNFKMQLRFFESMLQDQQLLVHVAAVVLSVIDDSVDWQLKSVARSFTEPFQALMWQEPKEIEHQPKRSHNKLDTDENDVIDNRRTQRTHSMMEEDISGIQQMIRKNQSCLLESDDSIEVAMLQHQLAKTKEDLRLCESARAAMSQDYQKECSQLQATIKVLKNVLEVSIDQQYKIINLGSVKAQNLVAEFLKVLENSLSTEGTFDLKKKITDIQDHFKKQEHLDDPFRENTSLVLNELQSRYQKTLDEYKREILGLQETIKGFQSQANQHRQSCSDHQATLNEFKTYDQEITSLTKQNQMLKRIVMQMQGHIELETKSQGSTQPYDQAFMDTDDSHSGTKSMQEPIRPRISTFVDKRGTGHGAFCKQDECTLF